MATLMLKAHFDGEQIRLDEPVELAKDSQLIVIVPDPDAELAAEREDWYRMGEEALARAYGDDEPEYSIEDCTTLNRQRSLGCFVAEVAEV